MIEESYQWLWPGDPHASVRVEYNATVFDVPESHAPKQTGRGWDLSARRGERVDGPLPGTFSVGTATWRRGRAAVGRPGHWYIAAHPAPAQFNVEIDVGRGTFTVGSTGRRLAGRLGGMDNTAVPLALHDYVVLKSMVEAFLARYAEVSA